MSDGGIIKILDNYTWKKSTCGITNEEGKPLWEEYTLYKKDKEFYCGVIEVKQGLSECNYEIDVYLSPDFRWQGSERDFDVAKFKAIVKTEELYKQYEQGRKQCGIFQED